MEEKKLVNTQTDAVSSMRSKIPIENKYKATFEFEKRNLCTFTVLSIGILDLILETASDCFSSIQSNIK